ncbi:hypothetical protein SISSUDRAFT_1055333 [Sistotremastrum suecicum HHB10207 ss-3]|uniref:Uncharacterized protein n=1 Tax=Sistotremastrum suecicum HHB10207 ss-3 TaxID=1314776 RepID=A0A165XVQ5_9AGAM|nr:hypothetical protein SISSUDRAFT_1055333 [Sistotremastrum suecicum HHB10207 ss-3]
MNVITTYKLTQRHTYTDTKNGTGAEFYVSARRTEKEVRKLEDGVQGSQADNKNDPIYRVRDSSADRHTTCK